MDKNYVLSTIFITMSCTTVAINQDIDGYGFTCPEQSIEIPSEQCQYLFSMENKTYISSPNTEEMGDLEVLVSFAKKMLDNEVSIDEDIQRVIEENFWEML